MEDDDRIPEYMVHVDTRSVGTPHSHRDDMAQQVGVFVV